MIRVRIVSIRLPRPLILQRHQQFFGGFVGPPEDQIVPQLPPQHTSEPARQVEFIAGGSSGTSPQLALVAVCCVLLHIESDFFVFHVLFYFSFVFFFWAD